MITKINMKKARSDVCKMSNSQLKEFLSHVKHELHLSNTAVKEGMELDE